MRQSARWECVRIAGFLCVLAVAISLQAIAGAMYNTSLDATLIVSSPAGASLQLLASVEDSDSDPFTTFAFVDPFGSSGSTAMTASALSFPAANRVQGILSTNGNSVGLVGTAAVSAFSQANDAGGFILVNSGTSTVVVPIAINFSWMMDTSASDPTSDSALARVGINYVVDGNLVATPLDVSLDSPPNRTGSNAGSFSATLSLTPSAVRVVSIFLDSAGLAQSLEPAPTTVPEPRAAIFFVLGLLFVVEQHYQKRK